MGELPESASPWYESADHIEETFERMDIVRDQAELALDALLELTPNQRICIVLHFIYGLSYSEAGVILGIDKSNAYRNARRGLARMREIMSETD